MRIVGIKLSGFRGVREKLSLELPSGFVVIAGRNGSGKSTLCDAVEFVLTGDIRLSSQHKENQEGIRDYIWWRGTPTPEEHFVELELLADSGVRHTIRRTQTEVSVSPHSSIEELLCHEVTTLDSPIVQLCRTTILRDEEITQLSVDLKETDRFNFVQSALGTADFSSVEQKAKEVQRLLNEESTRSDQAYASTRTRVEQLTTQLSTARAELAKADDLAGAEKALRSELNDAHGSIEELIAKAESTVAELRLQTDALVRLFRLAEDLESRRTKSDSPAHRRAVEELTTQLAATTINVAALEAEAKALAELLSTAQADSPRAVSMALLKEHGERLGLVDGRCPLCGSDQSEEHYLEHLTELAEAIATLNNTLADLTSKSADKMAELAAIQQEMNRITKDLATLKQRDLDLASEEQALAVEAERLGIVSTERPMQLKELIGDSMESHRAQILRIERSLATVQASRAVLLISSLEQDLNGARESLAAADKRMSKVRSASNQIKESLDTIRRVRGEYIDEQLAQLDPLLLELYQRLRPHVNWPEVRYRLRGDVRKMLSFEVGDGINPSFVFSSGQRRAAGIAFLLALHLSRSWCALKTLILDDPVQHIDDYRALHLTEVLAAIRKTGLQVICTVEDEALAKLLSRRLRNDAEGPGAIVQMSYSSKRGVYVKSIEPVQRLPKAILVPA